MMEAIQALIERYSVLRDQAEAEQGKNSNDYSSYSTIVDGLNKPEPRATLERYARLLQATKQSYIQRTDDPSKEIEENFMRELALVEQALARYEAASRLQATDHLSAYMDDLFTASLEQLQRMREIIEEK
jgi:hypothetical protein